MRKMARGRKPSPFTKNWQPCRWRLPADLPEADRQAVERQLPAGRWVATADALALGLPAPIRRLLLADHAQAG